MQKEDADEIQKIFDGRENPHFTILRRKDIPIMEGENMQMIELFAETTTVIWYLAKEVESNQMFRIKINQAMEKFDLEIKLLMKKISEI